MRDISSVNCVTLSQEQPHWNFFQKEWGHPFKAPVSCQPWWHLALCQPKSSFLRKSVSTIIIFFFQWPDKYHCKLFYHLFWQLYNAPFAKMNFFFGKQILFASLAYKESSLSSIGNIFKVTYHCVKHTIVDDFFLFSSGDRWRYNFLKCKLDHVKWLTPDHFLLKKNDNFMSFNQIDSIGLHKWNEKGESW